MGVPKKHKTKSGRNQRRNHHKIQGLSTGVCTNCGNPTRPHYPCLNCRNYNGRTV